MQEQSDINFRMPTISMGGLFSFAVELLLFILFYKVYMENYYQTVLMRGATRGTFILPRLVCDLAVCFVFFESLGFSNAIYGIDTTGWQQLGLLWCVA